MSKDKDNKKEQQNSGILRAVPIILASAAIFIAVCLIFGGTGAFGYGVSAVLRGLFASGAFAIPLLLVFHALFFVNDFEKKKIVSRVIISLISILIVSSIDYTVCYFGTEPVFDPGAFYSAQTAGGFIGGAFSFCIAKLIGFVGLIILDLTVVVAYTIIFIGKKDSPARRGLLTILEFFTSLLALAEGKVKKNAEDRRAAKAENRRLETERRHAEFFDDQFFDGDGSMDELRIRELGIHETKDPTKSEQRPNLQAKVHNKSAFSKEELKKEDGEQNALKSEEKSASSFNFNIAADKDDRSSDPGHVFFGATDTKFAESNKSFGIDESADSVFTKDFDPFDFATGEKLVAKPSTKAQPAPRSSGVNELIPPLSSVTEKSIAEQKRREEFELRKRTIIASRAAAAQTAPTTASITPTPAQTPTPAPTSSTEEKKTASTEGATAAFAASLSTKPEVTMEFGSPDASADTEVAEQSISTPDVSLASESEALGETIPADIDENIDRAYEQIAEKVLQNNPAYAVSANKSTFKTIVHESEPQELPETPEPIEVSEAASFQPYTPPTPDASTDSAAEVAVAGAILVTERTLFTPSKDNQDDAFLEREIARYSVADEEDSADEEQGEAEAISDENINVAETSIKEEVGFDNAKADVDAAKQELATEKETLFTFGEESEDEPTEPAPENDLAEIFGEEEQVNEAPIPPEEQNPDVIKQRAMFPFLDEEESKEDEVGNEAQPEMPLQKNEIYEEKFEAEEETPESALDIAPEEEPDDEPPFEKAEPVQMQLVPVEEKPKKKDYSSYVFPPIDLLHEVDEQGNENISEEIQDNADKLIDTLASFGVTASIKGVDRGPRITRYEVVPAKGVKVSNIMNLSDDIALNLAADGIRMEAPIPGKSAVGVEIPNKKSAIVRLRELIETEDFKSLKSKTSVCMGKDVAGQPVFADVAKMPHALIAGATGMGKSVCINSLMLSILYKARPDEVKFIMIDPKQVEFTMYNGIPHLLVPVVTDVKQAAGTLMWAVEEMERRYSTLQEHCVRNIDAYNDKVSANPSLGDPMSRIVIVIDEFAELIMQAKNPVESLIIRIAQKARAAGIHLIIGTQKPVKEVITGLIKSNIPSKLSCKVASNRDSILIFDSSGAEKLLDRGDMLIAFANSLKPQRVQCAFVADEEVEAVMDYLKQYSDGSNYDEEVMEEIRRAADKCAKKGGSDHDDDDDDESSYGEGYLNNKQFLDAVEIAVNRSNISTSLLQRKLSIGYGKAAKFLDVMEDMGIIGESNGSKPRDVLISSDEWHEKLARTSYD